MDSNRLGCPAITTQTDRTNTEARPRTTRQVYTSRSRPCNHERRRVQNVAQKQRRAGKSRNPEVRTSVMILGTTYEGMEATYSHSQCPRALASATTAYQAVATSCVAACSEHHVTWDPTLPLCRGPSGSVAPSTDPKSLICPSFCRTLSP